MNNILSKIYCLMVLLIVANNFLYGAEEIIFERKIPEEELKHSDLKIIKNDVSKCATVEIVKKNYSIVPERDISIYKMVVNYDKDTGKPNFIIIIRRKPFDKLILIYKRNIPESLSKHYYADRSSLSDKGGGIMLTRKEAKAIKSMTLEEIKKRFDSKYWDQFWGIQKVEFEYKGNYKGEFSKEPVIMVYHLSGNYQHTAEEKKAIKEEIAKWKEEALKRYLFPKETGNFIALQEGPSGHIHLHYMPDKKTGMISIYYRKILNRGEDHKATDEERQFLKLVDRYISIDIEEREDDFTLNDIIKKIGVFYLQNYEVIDTHIGKVIKKKSITEKFKNGSSQKFVGKNPSTSGLRDYPEDASSIPSPSASAAIVNRC